MYYVITFAVDEATPQTEENLIDLLTALVSKNNLSLRKGRFIISVTWAESITSNQNMQNKKMLS